jgi:hypothetical protein
MRFSLKWLTKRAQSTSQGGDFAITKTIGLEKPQGWNVPKLEKKGNVMECLGFSR